MRTNPKKTTVALLAGFLLYALNILLPHAGLIGLLFGAGAVDAASSLILRLLFLDGGRSSLAAGSFAFVIALCVLFAVNVYLLLSLPPARKAKGVKRASALSIFATALGYGCASCGATVVSALLPAIGLNSLAVSFPLIIPVAGTALYVVAIALSLASIAVLVRALRAPAVCPIDQPVR